MDTQELTDRQSYLRSVLPLLTDGQIDQMVSALQVQTDADMNETDYCDLTQNGPYRELMNMIGCQEAKDTVNSMIAAYKMEKIAESRKRTKSRQHFHCVFSGSPGTAKTTIARMYAKILASVGIIKKDTVAELSRADLIAPYHGQTAIKVKTQMNTYKGGVIFIDEAYALSCLESASKDSYGEEAITEIILFLEQSPETVVIFAGYPDLMEDFLASNPGLRSRIPYHVTFNDYTSEELVAISKKIAADQGYYITHSAVPVLTAHFDRVKNNTDFGNGRYCRNLVEKAIRNHANSLGVITKSLDAFMDPAIYSDEVLFSLDEQCFINSDEDPKEEKHKIGFRAVSHY